MSGLKEGRDEGGRHPDADVMRLVDDETHFVVQAPRPCDKTTAFQVLADED